MNLQNNCFMIFIKTFFRNLNLSFSVVLQAFILGVYLYRNQKDYMVYKKTERRNVKPQRKKSEG